MGDPVVGAELGLPLVIVGCSVVGFHVGEIVGNSVGETVGNPVGEPVGIAVGAAVGVGVGTEVGSAVIITLGKSVGAAVGTRVVGRTVGERVDLTQLQLTSKSNHPKVPSGPAPSDPDRYSCAKAIVSVPGNIDPSSSTLCTVSRAIPSSE